MSQLSVGIFKQTPLPVNTVGSNKKTFPLRTFVLYRKLTIGPALSCKARLGQVTLWVHHLPPRFCGKKGQYTPLQGPEHSFTKPRSMCSKGSKILSWFQKGMSRFLSWFQLNTWMIFSKLVDFAYNIDVHNFLGGFASEFVKLVSTEHIDGQKILSWF